MRVPETEEEAKECNQVNQVKTNDKNIWYIRLGKSVEQLVEHHQNAAELIIQLNLVESGKRAQRKNMAGNYGLISETYK